MNPLTIFNLAVTYGPTVLGLIGSTFDNKDLATKIKSDAGPIVDLLEKLGENMFPKASPAIHVIGGAILAFDLNTTKWLQGAINRLNGDTALVVDGRYGPKTRDAVEALQAKYGLVVDGLAGNVTRALLNAVLQNLPVLGTPSATKGNG